jgi:hypothetical protein
LDAGATWITAGTVGPNVTIFLDNGRTSEQAVCYRVVAFNEHGTSASNIDCTTPPAKPTNLAAAAAQGGINLTWADNSSAEDGYEVQRSTDATTFSTIADLGANATSYSDAGTTSSPTFWYRVRAKKDGGFSGFSSVVSATTVSLPPTAPSQVAAQPEGSGAINVTWQADWVASESFRVERSTDGGSSWTFVGTAPRYYGRLTDPGRTPEQQVCYRVIAGNTAGDSPPSPVDCTAPPAGPTDLTFAVSETGVQFTWSDNSAVEDGYLIMPVSIYLDYYGEGVLLPANSTSYVSIGNDEIFACREYLVPSCVIVVMALRDGGYSDWSNSVGVP